ncbi:helix-turn-helix domain-containing protein [Saccharothrix sp. 6-C]|uniref:helix-turn-helix domain-containing protein n=1 Tax=Saccharothrix sp. 6-C TaxID=2781735 RepID=UPI001F257DFB|nr:helix-turn-helix transcriptional regulator [Saccharothrix sp. 6-C]
MDGTCWGAAGLVRRGEFTDREAAFIASVAPAPAAATVVAVERASGGELLGLLLAAYGLTAREREVCREVIAGRSTSDMAARLALSAHTVRDHLKSVFGKVDVRSRGELVAKLRPEDGPAAS